MEVTTLGVPVPRAAGVRIRSTESAGGTGVIAGSARTAGVIARATRTAGVIAGSAGTARVIARATRTARTTGVIGWSARPPWATWVIAGSAWPPWATGVIAGSAGTARSTRATRIVRTSGSMAATRGRPAVISRRLWRSGSGVGKPGPHSQGRSAERSCDGHPSDKLLQLHDASPIH
ncbi:hypothetical protein A5652_25545 [Mycobacterium sp. 1165178.9]|nr:hypothetical protein A5652_25545 [Mycobacterium sp. 1165178.9]